MCAHGQASGGVLPPPLSVCVAFDNLLPFPVPQFLHQSNRNHNSANAKLVMKLAILVDVSYQNGVAMQEVAEPWQCSSCKY